MSSLDPNIQSGSSNVHSSSYIAPTQAPTTQGSKVDTGLSSIEKSKAVVLAITPPMDVPILTMPNSQGDMTLSAVMNVASSDPTGSSYTFLLSSQLQIDQAGNEVLSKWSQNLQQMAEEVRRLMASQGYIAQQQVNQQGNAPNPQGGVGGVEASGASGISATIGNIQNPEKVPEAANIPETESNTDVTKIIMVPMTAAALAGGAMALGGLEMSTVSGVNTNPFDGALTLIQSLQPIAPNLIQDIIPSINLLVMPLIYFTSWDSTVGSLKNKEKSNDMATAQDFAKQVVKMVSNPDFIAFNVVNKMPGADKMSPELKDQYAAMVKLVLASVSLALLYTVEVGKTGGGNYWGLEPQEFKGLLDGTIPMPTDKTKTIDLLKINLLTSINAQLSVLSSVDKSEIIEKLLEYMGNKHSIESMLQPSKVFMEVLQNTTFDATTNLDKLV